MGHLPPNKTAAACGPMVACFCEMPAKGPLDAIILCRTEDKELLILAPPSRYLRLDDGARAVWTAPCIFQAKNYSVRNYTLMADPFSTDSSLMLQIVSPLGETADQEPAGELLDLRGSPSVFF